MLGMSWLFWLLVASAAVFFALGWPAEALAQRPRGRAGLAWAGLTFGGPALVWLVIAILYSATGSTSTDSGGVAFFIGYVTSVAATVAGTLASRVLHRWPGARRLLLRRP
jgi:uncharacterized membrane protein